jgi:hypothetical protein
MDLAWRGRDQLNAADRAMLLALRGERYPGPMFAQEALVGWENAIRAAPDRADAHYWYGRVLLTQGLAMDLADSRTRAAASFRHGFDLDSALLSPLSGLIEIAAYERDTGELRRLRSMFLAQDSIRWRPTTFVGSLRRPRATRPRYAESGRGCFVRPRHIDAHSTNEPDGWHRPGRCGARRFGDSRRTHDRQQRQVAFYRAIFLALNRGQPQHALRLMDLKREVDPGPGIYQGYAVRYALMWDGDSAAGASGARALAAALAQDWNDHYSNSVTLWRLWQGDTTGAAAEIVQLRRVHSSHADMLDALLADLVHRPDASATLARLDSWRCEVAATNPFHQSRFSAAARTYRQSAGSPRGRPARLVFPLNTVHVPARRGRLAALIGDTRRHHGVPAIPHAPRGYRTLAPARGGARTRQLARLEQGRIARVVAPAWA